MAICPLINLFTFHPLSNPRGWCIICELSAHPQPCGLISFNRPAHLPSPLESQGLCIICELSAHPQPRGLISFNWPAHLPSPLESTWVMPSVWPIMVPTGEFLLSKLTTLRSHSCATDIAPTETRNVSVQLTCKYMCVCEAVICVVPKKMRAKGEGEKILMSEGSACCNPFKFVY